MSVDLGADEASEYKKAKSRFDNALVERSLDDIVANKDIAFKIK